MRPLFTSSSRLKLWIGQGSGAQVIAYAIGFNVSVSVGVEPVYVVGEYGPVALEPTQYGIVTGAMQIQRLRSKESLTQSLQATPDSTVSTVVPGLTAANAGQPGQGNNSVLNQQNLFRMLDPAQVLHTKTFDVDVYIRVPTVAANAAVEAGGNVTPNIATVQNLALSGATMTEVQLFKVKDCRITSRSTNITMGTITNEPVTFQGLLLLNKDDGFDDFSLDQVIKQG